MPTRVIKVLRGAGVAAAASLVVGLLKSVRRQPRPPTTGTARWTPLVEQPAVTTRRGPVEFDQLSAEPDGTD